MAIELEKLCIIDHYGTIRELGGITGPVLSPHKYAVSKILSMVNSGITVYEVNPADRNDKIRLTRSTVKTVNFPVVKKETVTKTTEYKAQAATAIHTNDKSKNKQNSQKPVNSDFNNYK